MPESESSEPGHDLRAKIQEQPHKLSSTERQIIELRFGILDGRARPLEEIGRQLSLTREQVRRIEAQALGKLPGSI